MPTKFPEKARRNLVCFILFRLFFNARFYYPVFAVLFMDYGLTMSQFAVLNAVWAGVIVVGEVPFGAVADRLGRRPLIIGAAVLMVLEMGVLLMAPVGVPAVAFWFFLVNRILSGCAEALASGADEALAYDSLVAEQKESLWAEVLKRMMVWQSVAFFFAMLLGGAVFDSAFLNQVGGWVGMDWNFEQEETVRFPIWLTFLTGCACLVAALAMREPKAHSDRPGEGQELSSWSELKGILRWLVSRRVVMGLIIIGLLFDSTIRMMVTLGSEYFRLIQYPEAMFGVLGALTAGTGWISGLAGKQMVSGGARSKNFLVLGGIGLVGLVGVAFHVPYWGYGFWVVLMVGFGLLNFFMSTYINVETASHRRATVLSVKSLAFNLAYGLVGLFYAGWTAYLQERTGGSGEADTFQASLPAFPVYFLVTFGIGWVVLRRWFDPSRGDVKMNS